jgi:hypothetical protein
MMTVTRKNIREAAQELIEANIQAEPAITKAYLFPSEDQIRLIYVDPTTSPTYPDERVAPYYFSPSQDDDLPYVSAVALVLPEEAESVPLPEGWGNWDEAEVIYPKTDVKSKG